MLLVHCHLIISRVGKIATAWARLVHRGTNRQVFDGEAPLGNDLHSSDNFPFGMWRPEKVHCFSLSRFFIVGAQHDAFSWRGGGPCIIQFLLFVVVCCLCFFVFLCSLPTSGDAPCPALKSNWAAIIVRIGDRMHALRMHFGTEDFGIFIWNNQVIWCTKKQDKPKSLTPQHQDIWGRAAGFGFSVTLSDFVAPYLMGQYQPLAGMSCRRPHHEEILCDCDLVVIQFLSIALFQDCFRIIHHPHQDITLSSLGANIATIFNCFIQLQNSRSINIRISNNFILQY